MFENPRRGRQARNVTTNVPKILDLKSSSEQIYFRKLSLGAPDEFHDHPFCPSARRGYETGQAAVDDYYNDCGNVKQHHQQPRLQNSPYFRLC